MTEKRQSPSLSADARRIYRLVAKFAKYGALVALICHSLPPHYRPVCSAIASLCGAGVH